MQYEDILAGKLARIMARKSGFDTEESEIIGMAAMLHDIGKGVMPQELFSKKEQLTAEEKIALKYHTIYGAQMLLNLNNNFGALASEIALYHHENFDGTGYWGKFTSELPAYVPIVSICDVYSVLITARPYKNAWTHTEAMEYIKGQSGKKFCPELVALFFTLFENDTKFPTEKMLTNNELLRERIEVCFARYKASMLQKHEQEIFEASDHISYVSNVYVILTHHPNLLTDEEAAYLLRFENPLLLLANEWRNYSVVYGADFEGFIAELVTEPKPVNGVKGGGFWFED